MPYDGGSSIGRHGSENGVILRDEEHMDGARITLEQDGRIAPVSITCGIYGRMVHTCSFAERERAESEYKGMKKGLSEVADLIPLAADPTVDDKLGAVSRAIGEFVERH